MFLKNPNKSINLFRWGTIAAYAAGFRMDGPFPIGGHITSINTKLSYKLARVYKTNVGLHPHRSTIPSALHWLLSAASPIFC